MEENNGMFSPISFKPMPEQIKQLLATKPSGSEDKMYIILYVHEDNQSFALAQGRMECYIMISRIMEMYPETKIHESVVLVEVPAVNRSGEGEWMMKHPHNATTIYQFCKTYEPLFPNIEFNIEGYNVNEEEVSAEDNNNTTTGMQVDGIQLPGPNEMMDVYKEIMAEKESGETPIS